MGLPSETMQIQSTKAIVIKATPFQDNQKILSIFSEELGLASIIIKGLSSKASQKISLSTPLCEAEFFFSKGRSDLLVFQEGSILNLHLPLRAKLSYLETAFSLCNILMPLQMPGKPSPHLYALLSSFLKQIPQFLCPKILISCFKLKILFHEGLYHPQEQEDTLSTLEKSTLEKIALSRNFSILKEIDLPEELFLKLENLFIERTHGI